ncbi:DNA polymerase-1 [Paenibacillus sp. 1182]|uniref:5'-3' exonuclease n=1 Tax=Paenibacillus sp. 1182 TaxID=2806565 RepID=UPI001AE3DFA5|nr:5'-3' exonuclease H3TH domain-containing protein [Paenibacillus sp. 1182]MBP1309259.1 DNA polymerase-1 [Paenibacillus sp. 1182]
MNSLLLIDGSSLLTTSFFATAPLDYQKAKTPEEMAKSSKKLMQVDGVYTNGVYTMIDKLLKIIKNQSPKYLAVAWDLNRQTFRRDMYPEYKANRSETRPELKSQYPLAQEVLNEMGIAQFIYEGYEADDIIGTLSNKMSREVPVYILTKDQDALQLVNERVRLWYMTNKAEEMYEQVGLNSKEFNIPEKVFEFTPLYVHEFYHVEPIQIIDRKAIEGDTSDNIPGVKGVGESSVVPLLNEFKSVEGIYDFLENNDELTVKTMIKELGIKRSPVKLLTQSSESELVGKESALLSKRLATIDVNMACLQDVKLEDLYLQINEERKKDIFKRLAFNSLLDSVESTQARTA